MKDQIKKSLSRKSSEELRTIFEAHDLEQWSQEVFEVIPEILKERDEKAPETERVPPTAKEKKRAERGRLALRAADAGSLIKGVGILTSLLLAVVSFFGSGGSVLGALSGILNAALVGGIVCGIGCILETLGAILASLEDGDSSRR